MDLPPFFKKNIIFVKQKTGKIRGFSSNSRKIGFTDNIIFYHLVLDHVPQHVPLPLPVGLRHHDVAGGHLARQLARRHVAPAAARLPARRDLNVLKLVTIENNW